MTPRDLRGTIRRPTFPASRAKSGPDHQDSMDVLRKRDPATSFSTPPPSRKRLSRGRKLSSSSSPPALGEPGIERPEIRPRSAASVSMRLWESRRFGIDQNDTARSLDLGCNFCSIIRRVWRRSGIEAASSAGPRRNDAIGTKPAFGIRDGKPVGLNKWTS